MALKLNRNLDNNISITTHKNIIKSEKAYPVCFAVFSRLLSASKRRFQRFISERLTHVTCLRNTALSREGVCVVCCLPKVSRGFPLLGTF